MSSMQYSLEIKVAGSHDTTYSVFEADKPFQSFNVGDLINQRAFDSSSNGSMILEVVKVEHIIWHSEDQAIIKHTILVYTKEVENTREVRGSL